MNLKNANPSPPLDAATLRALVDDALTAAKYAINGWGCYAKSRAEHTEIARLHGKIESLERALADAAAPRPVETAGERLQADSLKRLSRMTPPPPAEAREELPGLNLDMLDADRLRRWADHLMTFGPNISHWGDGIWVAGEMNRLAGCIECEVKAVGALRAQVQALTLALAEAAKGLHEAEKIAANKAQAVTDVKRQRDRTAAQMHARCLAVVEEQKRPVHDPRSDGYQAALRDVLTALRAIAPSEGG